MYTYVKGKMTWIDDPPAAPAPTAFDSSQYNRQTKPPPPAPVAFDPSQYNRQARARGLSPLMQPQPLQQPSRVADYAKPPVFSFVAPTPRHYVDPWGFQSAIKPRPTELVYPNAFPTTPGMGKYFDPWSTYNQPQAIPIPFPANGGTVPTFMQFPQPQLQPGQTAAKRPAPAGWGSSAPNGRPSAPFKTAWGTAWGFDPSNYPGKNAVGYLPPLGPTAPTYGGGYSSGYSAYDGYGGYGGGGYSAPLPSWYADLLMWNI
jgi:hypothetical protein